MRLDKLEMRLRELEENFHTLFEPVKTNPKHRWHSYHNTSQKSKSNMDNSTQELLRIQKEIAVLRNKLMMDPFKIPNLRPDDKQRPRSDIKISSTPRDHHFVINEQELKQQHRKLIEKDQPIFEFVHFTTDKSDNEQGLVAYVKYNSITDNCRLSLYSKPKNFIDSYTKNMFLETIFPQLLAFQIDVRNDPQKYKRTHQQAHVYWMDSWFRCLPENLPEAIK